MDNFFPNNAFIIEDIPLKENYQFRSFKVGIDKSIRENILKEEIWPEGVEISNYDFFRKTKRRIHPNRQFVRRFPIRKKWEILT